MVSFRRVAEAGLEPATTSPQGRRSATELFRENPRVRGSAVRGTMPRCGVQESNLRLRSPFGCRAEPLAPTPQTPRQLDAARGALQTHLDVSQPLWVPLLRQAERTLCPIPTGNGGAMCAGGSRWRRTILLSACTMRTAAASLDPNRPRTRPERRLYRRPG